MVSKGSQKETIPISWLATLYTEYSLFLGYHVDPLLKRDRNLPWKPRSFFSKNIPLKAAGYGGVRVILRNTQEGSIFCMVLSLRGTHVDFSGHGDSPVTTQDPMPFFSWFHLSTL